MELRPFPQKPSLEATVSAERDITPSDLIVKSIENVRYITY